MGANIGVGRYGEDVAARYLESHGMRIVERNWRCGQGEIDIVAIEGDIVAVVEVKTRRSQRCGSPFEAIDPRKAARLRRLAVQWLRSPSRERAESVLGACSPAERRPPPVRQLRIDAVAVLLSRRGPAEVRHLRGVA